MKHAFKTYLSAYQMGDNVSLKITRDYLMKKKYLITEQDAEHLDQAIDTLRAIVKAEGSIVDQDVLKTFHLLAPIIPLELKSGLPYTTDETEQNYGV